MHVKVLQVITSITHGKILYPYTFITIRPNDIPWMNSELRKQIRIRNRLHKL